MNKRIKNKVVFITGGANGIGKATALLFSKDNKVIVIDNDEKACKELKEENKEIEVYNEDITNYNNIEKIIDEIFNKYKNIDILINNAGIQTIAPISKLTLKEWDEVLKVNLTSNFYITQLVSNRMKNDSTILNISSTHYNKPRVDHAHYDISKSGIVTLTKLFAIELAPKKITVNSIAIGATYTNMNKIFEEKESVANIAKNKIPLKCICNPEDIADSIYDVINDFSQKTTGSVFVIDGGRNITC